MDNGWIKLHRKLLEWEWFTDPYVLMVFMWLLLSANHEDKRWRGKLIKRGQKLTSVRHAADALCVDKMVVSRVFNKLKSTGEIKIEGSNKFGSIITICKYSDYQLNDNDSVCLKHTIKHTEEHTKGHTVKHTEEHTKQEYKNNNNNLSSSIRGDELKNFDRQKVLNCYAQDQDWIYAKSEEVRIPVDEVKDGLRVFSLQIASERDESDTNESELVRHFTNWLRNDKRIKEQQKNKLTNGNKERSVLGRDNPELVRIRAELDKAIEARADY